MPGIVRDEIDMFVLVQRPLCNCGVALTKKLMRQVQGQIPLGQLPIVARPEYVGFPYETGQTSMNKVMNPLSHVRITYRPASRASMPSRAVSITHAQQRLQRGARQVPTTEGISLAA